MTTKKIRLKHQGKEFEISFAFCPPGEYTIVNRAIMNRKNIVVQFTSGFWVQDITVSLGLYEFVYGAQYYDSGMSEMTRNYFPWTHIAFREVQDFLTKLNRISFSNSYKYLFDIPTVEEWEHALLCGKSSPYDMGDSEKDFGEYAWYAGNSSGVIHPSGQKKANHWGLYDMYGNLKEYCHNSLIDTNESPILNPKKWFPQPSEPLPWMGGDYEDCLEDCKGFNVLGYNNEFVQNVGIRLILRKE